MNSLTNSLRWLIVPTLASSLLLGGCALNSTDRSVLEEHGISAPVRAKMAHLAPLTLPEIVEVSRCGMLPEYITQYLRATHQPYHLSSHDVFWLNRHGVSSTVITYLVSTPDTLALPSDRMAVIDWSPYFVPFYDGSLNWFGHDYYLPPKKQMAHHLPTLSEQNAETQRIVSE